jgi:hypothetical protein
MLSELKLSGASSQPLEVEEGERLQVDVVPQHHQLVLRHLTDAANDEPDDVQEVAVVTKR